MKGGYNSIYLGLITKLSECDFQESADRLGLEYVDGGIQVNFLKRAQIVFYEADDDFPVDIQIMLDKTALQFMEFECLAFMVGCFVRAFIKTAKTVKRSRRKRKQ